MSNYKPDCKRAEREVLNIKCKYKNEALNIIQEKYPDVDFTSLDNYNDSKFLLSNRNSMFAVGDLVDELGWDIAFVKLPHSVYGFTAICDKKTIIFLNESHELAVNCFTIAHQIGYYVLHGHFSNETNKDLKYIEEERKKNAEANAFASKLLMPEYRFVNMFDRYKGNISKIAFIFNVTINQCKGRALNLGLINCI